MKVLLPVDITHSVKSTIEELGRLVNLKECQVVMLYVKEELPSYERVIESIGDFKEDYGNKLEKKAKAFFDDAEALLKPLCKSFKTEIVSGPAAMMIETVARDEKCDLTVLTPGTKAKVQQFFLGSVSSKVVKHGPGTIVISRPKKTTEESLKKVIMGIDGSSQSRSAIKQAAKYFELKDAEITLIHVVSVADVMKMVSPVEYISIVENNMLMEGETFLAEGKKILAELGFTKVFCVLKEGDPSAEILKLADSLPADLVVIGAQGRGAVQHFLLGSVSQRIATHCSTTVAVVKTAK